MKAGQFQFRHLYVYVVLLNGYADSAWGTQTAAMARTRKLRKEMGRKNAKRLGLDWYRCEVLDKELR